MTGRRNRRPEKAGAVVMAAMALFSASGAHAQQWLVNSVINNQVVETAICDSALKKGQKLPDICAKYPKYSGVVGPRKAAPSPSVRAGARAAGSGKFNPDAGDDSLRKLADGAGSTPLERQQLLQIAQAGKALFEQKYGAKGWKNDLAGAYAFFIIAVSTVYNGSEPDAATQDRLFDALSTTLAQAPELAKTSARDKTAMYNMLVAGGGVPLLFYIDGKQQNDAAEVDQARKVAAEFSRKLLNTEPQALAEMGR